MYHNYLSFLSPFVPYASSICPNYLPLLPLEPYSPCIPKSCSPSYPYRIHLTWIFWQKDTVITYTTTQRAIQSTDLIRGFSASPSIYKLCVVASHFIFFPRVQYTGAWLPLYLCDGDISSMTWGPFMLSLQHNHTSSLYLDGVRGALQPSGEAYRHTTLYHLWQPINTSLTFLILI